MKFNQEQRQEIYNLYMKEVADVLEACDWKVTFDAKEVVSMVLDVIELGMYDGDKSE